jgi:hypothetical protein
MGIACGCDRNKTLTFSGLGVLLQGFGDSGDSSFTGFGDVADALWPTTGDIDTATNSLALTIQQLGSDIFNDNGNASDPNYQAFLDAWNTFVADFTQWKGVSLYWNPTRRDELVDYRKRFNDLLTLYHSFSGALTLGIQAVPGAVLAPSLLVQWGGLISKVVGGVAAVGGIYLAVKFAGLLPKRGATVSNPRRKRRRRR